jgi:cysteine synthase A
MPDWMSEERINIIKSFGAEVKLISREDGGFIGCIELCRQAAQKEMNTFLPCQFSNEHNCEAHYKSTGPEIWQQLKQLELEPDAFIAVVGTGGTVMGIGRYLKEKNPNIRIHPLEPLNSPTLSTGSKIGRHRIQGISDDFIPPVLNLDRLDRIISIDDGDAIIMAQMLAKRLGLGVGISSGANFLGAVAVQNELGSQSVVATVFVDDNKKYLSTDLQKVEPIKENFISTDIRLLGLTSFRYDQVEKL